MSQVTEKNEDGTERVVVSGSKVITGTVQRVTGAGNVIVYPSEHDPSLKKGEEAIIVTETTPVRTTDFAMELVMGHVMTPYDSDYAIMVRSVDRTLDKCRMYCGGTQLSAVDAAGNSRTELPLTLGSSLTFRIPSSLHIQKQTSVELRDGDTTIILESVASLPGAGLVTP
jgi:hypothetical protein